MSLAGMTLTMLAVTNALGLAASFALGRGWVPAKALYQPGRQDWGRFRGRLPLIALNMGLVMLGAGLGLSLMGPHMPTARPPLLSWALQLLAVALIDEAWFYVFHRLAHAKPALYRRIHRVHHRAHAPLPLDYVYVHPLEWSFGALGSILGFAVVALATGGLNAWTFLGHATLKQLRELRVHSGLRVFDRVQIPLLGTVEHHDTHHARPNSGNYGTASRLLDRLLGTESARP